MTINKFQGKTKEEAIEKAKKEFGVNAVIMNVKELKPKGFLRAFKSSTFEVTAAMEEKESFVNPINALKTPDKMHESINVAADEQITIPPIQEKKNTGKELVQNLIHKEIVQAKSEMQAESHSLEQENAEEDDNIEERLDSLSNILEEKLGVPAEESEEDAKATSEELDFVKLLYNTLLKNEVNEKYANQILDEIEGYIRPGNSLDLILSNIYQKLILRFGQPKTINLLGRKPKVIFFVGPTGVGKTTTIAKIASKYKVEQNKKVAFLTADTYRIAATEQLRVYANILDAPLSIIYSAEELNTAIERVSDYDLVFVDTAGFSHKNQEQKEDIKKLIHGMSSEYNKEVYLVLSATTKYQDLLDISDIYHDIADYKLIFTKLDETSSYGNILNVKLYSGADLSYVTNGQNVPEDIEIFDTQKIVKQLLGGR